MRCLTRRSLFLATAFLFVSCGLEQKSYLLSPTSTSDVFLALLAPTPGSELLYVSVPVDVASIQLTKTSSGQQAAVAVKEFQTIGDRRIFVTETAFMPLHEMTVLVESTDAKVKQQLKFIDKATLGVWEFGTDSSRKFVAVASETDGLSIPRDLEFNPARPGELWIVNKKTEGVVVIQNAGAQGQQVQKRVDSYSSHFMSKVSSLSFGANGMFATCHESRNEASGNTDFMGPTMWTSDMNIFAKVNQTNGPGVCDGSGKEKLGSHMDMLHQSPLCMGIAHDSGNAYWAFDGMNGNIVRYDFVRDHGPGAADHSDGRLARYSDVKVTKVNGVPSHMVLDKATGWLYIADTGTGKIIRLNTKTGTEAGRLQARGEPLAQYVAFKGATSEAFAEGMRQPSGLALRENMLFVSDHATGEIIAFSLETKKELGRIKTDAQEIMGITHGSDNKLWYVDAKLNKVVRIDP